jgi:hypothetical protein
VIERAAWQLAQRRSVGLRAGDGSFTANCVCVLLISSQSTLTTRSLLRCDLPLLGAKRRTRKMAGSQTHLPSGPLTKQTGKFLGRLIIV